MSLVALETELRSAIEALPSAPLRVDADFNIDNAGQVLLPDQWYYALRLTLVQEVAVDSNNTKDVAQAEIDMKVRMSLNLPDPRRGSDYYGQIGLDQAQLVDKTFYALPSVFEIDLDEVPQIVESVTRVGNVLVYTAAANIVLD